MPPLVFGDHESGTRGSATLQYTRDSNSVNTPRFSAAWRYGHVHHSCASRRSSIMKGAFGRVTSNLPALSGFNLSANITTSYRARGTFGPQSRTIDAHNEQRVAPKQLIDCALVPSKAPEVRDASGALLYSSQRSNPAVWSLKPRDFRRSRSDPALRSRMGDGPSRATPLAIVPNGKVRYAAVRIIATTPE